MKLKKNHKKTQDLNLGWFSSRANHKTLFGSGCGSVGRLVASDSRGRRFKSSHRRNCIQNISNILLINWNKEKGRMGWLFPCLCLVTMVTLGLFFRLWVYTKFWFIKDSRQLDSNPCPLVSEVTALSAVPFFWKQQWFFPLSSSIQIVSTYFSVFCSFSLSPFLAFGVSFSLLEFFGHSTLFFLRIRRNADCSRHALPLPMPLPLPMHS